MSLAIDPVVGLTCRILAAVIFGSAALGKVRDFARFTGVLRDYQVMPARCVVPAAMIVIVTEGFITLTIWFSTLRAIAVGVAIALLASYALAIALNLWRGRREIDCGCSFGGIGEGGTGEPISWVLPFRNGLLALVCLIAGLPEARELSLPGWGVAVVAATVLTICYRAWGVLLANRPQLLRMRES
jgi:hypothetical protein